MHFHNGDGNRESVSVDDRYIYQRGQHYIQLRPGPDGSSSGNINYVAPGVFSNLALEFPNQPGRAVIAGKFPPSDELLIL